MIADCWQWLTVALTLTIAQMDLVTDYVGMNLHPEDERTWIFHVLTYFFYTFQLPGANIIFYAMPKVQKFGRKKFDKLETIRQIRQSFPPSNFCVLYI